MTASGQMPAAALLRLMQLVSPALPIGGYNFSQGLEFAIHSDWVRDEATALNWIRGLARSSMGTLDVPVLVRLHTAWSQADGQTSSQSNTQTDTRADTRADTGTDAPISVRAEVPAVDYWSRFLIASRETSELRAEDRHLGRSLAKVLAEGGLVEARPWLTRPDATFATLFALACTRASIDANQCAWGYLWTWAENQVLAAVKAVPLGQSAGQRMLDALISDIPSIAADAAAMGDEEIGSAAPLHLIASASHETQYTRLFRS